MAGEFAGDAGRPWLASYPANMPATIDAGQASILDLYRGALGRCAEAEAIRYFDRSIRFRELDALSDAFACWLSDSGVGRRDRVGIILQNTPWFVIAALAAWKLGAIPVPGNPMYTERELALVFSDYAPTALLCHDDCAVATRSALDSAGLGHVAVATAAAHDLQTRNDSRLVVAAADVPGRRPENDMSRICERYSGRSPAAAEPAREDIAFILYTSGTTGRPKGAIISHGALAFNTMAGLAWMDVRQDSRIIALAPLFHITGFVLHMSVALASGCSMALHYRFHPEAVLDVIREYRPTVTIAAITAFNALMNAPSAAAEDFRSFEAVFSGGAPIAPALRDAIREKLGVTIHPAYGMTESCSPTHFAPIGSDVPCHRETGALAVGLPISSTDARIAGPDGEVLPPGEAGEIWMRGPQVMTGYWNKPDETAATLHDGWLRSGDVGIMDEAGWFYVVDRQKDMISASGFKVWPREVEDVLVSHPGVREAAVIGVPDPYRGETVYAFVSATSAGTAIEPDDLIAFCRTQLAAYKVPRAIEIVSELPKTATGKIQRSVLRERKREG